MKLKDGFVLRQVAGQTVVLPCGDALDLNMMITLNDTGTFLWERLRDMDRRAKAQFGENAIGCFKQGWTVEQLERRFSFEDRQLSLFDEMNDVS